MISRRVFTAAVLCALSFSVGAQELPNRLTEPARRIVALKLRADAATDAIQPALFAEIQLELARLYRDLGMVSDEQRALALAAVSARVSPLAEVARAAQLIHFVGFHRRRGALLEAWKELLRARAVVAQVPVGAQKLGFELDLMALEFDIVLELADIAAQVPDDHPVDDSQSQRQADRER